jgi:hypothetical protein
MQHYAWFSKMLTPAIRPADLWRESATRHWSRSSALVIGTALGLSLAGAPVARSAQTDSQLSIETGNQLSIETGNVIEEITVGAITQRICGGRSCTCPTGQIVTGGGAQCAAPLLDTLQESGSLNSQSWQATCTRLIETRRPAGVATTGGGGTTEPVVVDIQRFPVAPATTQVFCATP